MKIEMQILVALACISAVFAKPQSDGDSWTPEPKKECVGGLNDEWTNCGSACPLTCEKPNIGVCTKQCIINTCRCKEGFVRASDGQCIKPEECSSYENKGNDDTETNKCTKKCTGGPNDQCTLCGSACPLTCDKPKTSICTLQCLVNVCQCKSGYVRNSNGQCIKPDKCPKKNPETCSTKCKGGKFDKCTKCGTACPKTCDNLSPKICTDQCLIDVCQCVEGYVRDKISGMCIKAENCPVKKNIPKSCTAKCTGGKHDKCTLCGEYCPPSCENPKRQSCSLRCAENVCRCEQGYLRDKNGQCVRADKCPVEIKDKNC